MVAHGRTFQNFFPGSSWFFPSKASASSSLELILEVDPLPIWTQGRALGWGWGVGIYATQSLTVDILQMLQGMHVPCY